MGSKIMIGVNLDRPKNGKKYFNNKYIVYKKTPVKPIQTSIN